MLPLMTETTYKPRVGQHQYSMFIPLPLYERIEKQAKETGQSIKDVILTSVEVALGEEK